MSKIFTGLLLASTAIILVAPATAFAQSAAPDATPAANAPASANASLGEVVVTSRRRAENVKDVPIAVTAVTAQNLDKMDIQDTTQLMNYTPGLQYSNFAVGNFNARLALRPVIFRGLTLTNDYGITAGSLIFLDGGPLLGGEAPPGLDIERVEVLRGPQSVYFGRSTMAGAVNYVTKGLPDAWHAQMGAEYGQYNTEGFNLSVMGPVVQDKLKVGIQFSENKHDGYYSDSVTPSYKLGAQETGSVSVEVEWTPIENFKVSLFTNYFENNDGVQATAQLNQGQDNCKIGGSYTYYCGTMPSYKTLGLTEVVNLTPQEAIFLAHPAYLGGLKFDPSGFGLQRKAEVSNLRADWTLPGLFTITSLSSYENDVSQGAQSSVFETPHPGDEYNIYDYSYNFDASNFDEEIRLSSVPYEHLPLRWTIGFNYLRGGMGREADLATQTYTSVGASTLNPESFFNFGFGTTKSHTYGYFGGIYYDILPQLELSLEGRYQVDELVGVPLASTVMDRANYYSFSPRVALNYKITPDVTAYVSYAKGARPGGFNTSIQPYEPGGAHYAQYPLALTQFEQIVGPVSFAFQQEFLTTYEVGLKGTYFNHLRLNADGYWGQLTNMQIAVSAAPASLPNSLTATSNAGLVDIWGAEADADLFVNRMLSFSATFAWNHTDIVQYDCTSCVPFIGTTNVSGNQLPDAPEYSGTLAMDLTDHTPWFNWDWFFHTDWVYRGIQHIAVYAQGGDVPARNVVNLRAGFQSHNVTLEGYVTNLFNDTNYLTIGQAEDYVTFGYTALQGSLPPPRVIGGRVKYQF